MRDFTGRWRRRRTVATELAPEPSDTSTVGVERRADVVRALVDREVALAGWTPTLRLLILRRSFWAGVLFATGVTPIAFALQVAIGRWW